MRSILWMSETLTQALRDKLSSEVVVASSARDFLTARRDAQTVSFVDASTLAQLDGSGLLPAQLGAVIAICDEALPVAISWLPAHPWLAHVISSTMLQHPLAAEHLGNVLATLTKDTRPRLLDWISSTVVARRVRLTHASRRVDRLERMAEFFDTNGVGTRTIELLRNAAEELLTNAFYDAPVAAGAVESPISRTKDVALPTESACDLVYGCRDDLALVRVRDPFGSLSRERLVQVLTRCARTDMQVEVDESMGGEGLGLWRIFTAASFVAISVVENRHTEFLIGIGKRAGARPFSFHLFFRESSKRRFWKLLDDQPSMLSHSVTIVPQ